jgi:hypothetical protein
MKMALGGRIALTLLSHFLAQSGRWLGSMKEAIAIIWFANPLYHKRPARFAVGQKLN